MPRLLAIGDVHGCSRALDALLLAVQLRPDDQVVMLGDYVDRGPDSRGVLGRVMALHATGHAVALRGNHELVMLSARTASETMDFWLAIGGLATLASYSSTGKIGRIQDIPETHWQFLESTCVDWFERDTHFFVH